MNTTAYQENPMKYDIEWHFKTLYEMFASKGVAVVIGETSVSNKNNLNDRLKWVDCFYGYSKSYGIPCVLWDNNIYANNGGEAHGYLNRGSGTSWYPDGKAVVDRIMSVLGITPGTTGVGSANASLDVDLSVANDVLQVEAGCAVERISLFDISGNCVLEAQNCSSCSVSALNKGVYIVRIDTNIGSSVKKIVKK
jgi:hypothetical protein